MIRTNYPNPTHSAAATPVRPAYTQPVRPVRPRCILRPKSGVPGHILGVSGPPSPENLEPYPEYLHPHEPGVSGQMAGLSEPRPVRPVQAPVRPAGLKQTRTKS